MLEKSLKARLFRFFCPSLTLLFFLKQLEESLTLAEFSFPLNFISTLCDITKWLFVSCFSMGFNNSLKIHFLSSLSVFGCFFFSFPLFNLLMSVWEKCFRSWWLQQFGRKAAIFSWKKSYFYVVFAPISWEAILDLWHLRNETSV